MIWVRIATSPPLQIAGGTDPQAAQYAATVSTGAIDLGGESNANATVSIRNAPAQARRALLLGAVGAELTVYRDTDPIYSGTVDALTLRIDSRSIDLQAQS